MTRAGLAYASLLACSCATACELPKLPAIPEKIGGDAPRVLIEVRRYADSMIEYTSCLRAELAVAGGDAAPAHLRAALILRNNQAVDEHKAILDLYAERVGPRENLRLAEYAGGESRDCLLGSSILKTGVVNGSAVVFFSYNKKAYLNLLKTTCPGLEGEGAFFAGISQSSVGGANPATRGVISPNLAPPVGTPLVSRVCEQDRIFPGRAETGRRVLGCPLGRFIAVSEQQALQMLAPAVERAADRAK